MKKTQFVGMQDYMALFVRRKWWILIIFVSLSALAAFLSSMLPMIYVSEAVLQIEPREVPTDFVKDIITGTANQRLSAIKQTLLSRANLLKILDRSNGARLEYGDLNNDDKIVRLRKRIEIEFVNNRFPGDSSQSAPSVGIRISYRARNPQLAQEVTDELASLFIEKNTRQRESQVAGTTKFLNSELNRIAHQLGKSEKDLESRKSGHRLELPESVDANLRAIDRLQQDKNTNGAALDHYRTLQLDMERELANTPQLISSQAIGRKEDNPVPTNPAVDAYLKKMEEYRVLLTTATEEHPSVQRLKMEIAGLKKQITPADLAAAERSEKPNKSDPMNVPNPVYSALQAELHQVANEIRAREENIKRLDAEISLITRRVQAAPSVSQEMSANLQEREFLAKQYTDLKSKLAEARLSENLETSQRGGAFAIVDPANLPTKPATPSRMIVFLAGCLLNLGLSLAIVLLAGSLDGRLYTLRELERCLEVPVLVEIPALPSSAGHGYYQRIRFMRALTAIVCMTTFLGGLYYLHLSQPAALRRLNPILETTMERMVNH
jgi:polysaccharide biosynthesis transport protein